MELTLFHDEITPIPFLDGCQAIEYDIRIAVLTRLIKVSKFEFLTNSSSSRIELRGQVKVKRTLDF